jgi:hypothetical protein
MGVTGLWVDQVDAARGLLEAEVDLARAEVQARYAERSIPTANYLRSIRNPREKAREESRARKAENALNAANEAVRRARVRQEAARANLRQRFEGQEEKTDAVLREIDSAGLMARQDARNEITNRVGLWTGR